MTEPGTERSNTVRNRPETARRPRPLIELLQREVRVVLGAWRRPRSQARASHAHTGPVNAPMILGTLGVGIEVGAQGLAACARTGGRAGRDSSVSGVRVSVRRSAERYSALIFDPGSAGVIFVSVCE